MPGAVDLKGRQDLCRYDAVTINFSVCGKAGMKFFGNESAAKDSDLRWQGRVEREQKSRRIETRDQIGMCALSECMDAGVCASGAMHPDHFLRYPEESSLELVLNGIFLRLTLPAGEQGAVVGDNQLQAPALLFGHRSARR